MSDGPVIYDPSTDTMLVELRPWPGGSDDPRAGARMRATIWGSTTPRRAALGLGDRARVAASGAGRRRVARHAGVTWHGRCSLRPVHRTTCDRRPLTVSAAGQTAMGQFEFS